MSYATVTKRFDRYERLHYWTVNGQGAAEAATFAVWIYGVEAGRMAREFAISVNSGTPWVEAVAAIVAD